MLNAESNNMINAALIQFNMLYNFRPVHTILVCVCVCVCLWRCPVLEWSFKCLGRIHDTPQPPNCTPTQECYTLKYLISLSLSLWHTHTHTHTEAEFFKSSVWVVFFRERKPFLREQTHINAQPLHWSSPS